MRVKGYTRPLSILQIKANSRKKYAQMAKNTMVEMLTPVGELCVHISYNYLYVCSTESRLAKLLTHLY